MIRARSRESGGQGTPPPPRTDSTGDQIVKRNQTDIQKVIKLGSLDIVNRFKLVLRLPHN